jgi:hypothetical protein
MRLGYGMQRNVEQNGEIFSAVFSSRKEGLKAMRAHRIFFTDGRLKEIEIRIAAPKKRLK